MEKFKLSLAERETNKNPRQLRSEDKIPATLYGPGVPSQSVQICRTELSHLPAAAYSHVIELSSGQGTVNAIIRNVQRMPTTGAVLNIEFYRIAEDRKLTVTVPLLLVGSSVAVKTGGILVELHQSADIECLPKDIPQNIEVDLSQITELEQGIHFSELKIPDTIKILNPLDEIVVRVTAPKAVVEDEKAEAAEGVAAAAEGEAATAGTDKAKAE